MVAILMTPLVGRSGELEKSFNEKHPELVDKILVEDMSKSRPHAEVDAEETEITEVGLERTPWYFAGGAVYTVVIKTDGNFTYYGEKNVNHLGKYTGHIATMDIKPLFQYIRGMDYFLLADFYSTGATDQPAVYTMVAQKGERKVVKNYGTGGPLKLWALETVIDALLAKASWAVDNNGKQ